MAMLGFDVDRGDQSATQLTNLNTTLQDTISKLNTQVNNLSEFWKGQDATTFVSQTWPQHKSSLENCKSALDQLIQTLKSQIQQQREASS